MEIQLNQFEQIIDEAILKRGLAYFKKGYVNEPEEISAGVYEAIVNGTEEYIVKITIKMGIVTKNTCTCPYVLGPVCKHVAALLFYFQKDALDITATKNKIPKKRKNAEARTKKQKTEDSLNAILHKISFEDIKSFIRKKATFDSGFRNSFLAEFAHLNPSESKEIYVKQLKGILKQATGREHYIDWRQTSEVAQKVNELLTTADHLLVNGKTKSALLIYMAVIEELIPALEFSDDSNGEIGTCIEYAIKAIKDMKNQNLSEELRIFLFDYHLTMFKSGLFKDWHWNLELIEMAIEIYANTHEAESILKLLSTLQKSEYMFEQYQVIQLRLIKEINGEDEANKYIEQNLSNSHFRRISIEKAIHRKDYQAAINLSLKGIEYYKLNGNRNFNEWYELLLKIAQIQKDEKKVIEYARYLFLNDFRNKEYYFTILKQNTPVKEWPAFIDEIVSELANKGWLNFDVIANIYVFEENWEKLLVHISQKPNFEKIQRYEKYLLKDYSAELIDLYESCIYYYTKLVGRHHYQTICQNLRRMLKLGGKNKVDSIVETLKKQFPQRKALMEELSRV